MLKNLKVGHVAALVCAALTVPVAGLAYWDLQDVEFHARGVMVPVLFGVLAVVFALFPGGPTFGEAVQRPQGERVIHWLAETPAWQKRVWLGGFLLGFYLGIWATDALKGDDSFALENQVIIGLVMAGMGYFVRRKVAG